MDYQDSLDYIWSLVNFETTPPETREPYTLERMARLLTRLGDPQAELTAIHVAGTKGKGSTSAMIESVLRAAGYHTALYSSPHLHSPRERIRIDGVPISREAWVDLVRRIRPHVDALGDVTTFELLTAMAFVACAEAAVDVAVVEVGLGGRLDATNFLDPLVSVITPLALEHTAVLGNTIEEIAAEKGGIIKTGRPVVTAGQTEGALGVLQRIANARGNALIVAPRCWAASHRRASLDGQTLDLIARDDSARYSDLHLALLGKHQVENAIVALTALEVARGRGVMWDDAALRTGFATVQWPARVEVVQRTPLVVVDGAHTEASARALVETVTEAAPQGWGTTTLILGVSRDKDVTALMAALSPLADRLILTRARHPRAADPAQLATHPAVAPRQPRVVTNVAEAVQKALEWAAPDALIVVAGSLFVAAEARAAMLNREA
ncbi:MAG: bifunctional folylpolyglutamate synthase/dihydrofolate synthase [Anaerolineales bacterium]|nr:bifunctional folylpolyglutamate synthase/dihydrofolate synthase [Anaerolineales bacterium]MCB9126739.1 bifunctional folylpolyglutamate synthase/dihydrofolate synthase [Ardenticatenales bacterium]